MPSYVCPRCGFKTSQRANFKRHLTRKHICDPINSDVTIQSIAESYSIYINPTDNLEEDTNIYTSNVDTHIQLKNKQGHKMYTCKYCNKHFNSSTSRCRHQRMYCKNKNENENKII